MVYSDIHLSLPAFIALDWALMTIALLPILMRIALRLRSRTLLPRHKPLRHIHSPRLALRMRTDLHKHLEEPSPHALFMRYSSAEPRTLYYGVPLHLSAHLLYTSWVSLFFIYISLWSSKAAFLAFYYSIFSLQGRRTRIALLSACVFTLFTFTLHMGLIAFWCSPVSANWSPPPGRHLCSAVHSIDSVAISTVANIATDVVVLSIPVRALWFQAKQFGNGDRAGLVFVFAMGSVSIIAALVRFVCLLLMRDVPKASITHTIDVWALVEIVSSILAVCAPSCRAFGRVWRGRRGGQRIESHVVGGG